MLIFSKLFLFGLGTKFTKSGKHVTIFTSVVPHVSWIKKHAEKLGGIQTVGYKPVTDDSR